jgi:Membrane protein involved in the export of O-antigen and teichoic acid
VRVFSSAIRLSTLAKGVVSPDAFWIASERIVSSALNIVTIVVIARFLGVVDYGHYAFGITLLGVSLAFGHLGLDGLLIKRIIEDNSISGTLLGSVAVAKYLIYLPLFVVALTPSLVIDLGPAGTHFVQALAPILLVTPLSSAMICWLNSQSEFRKVSLARITAVVVGTVGKVAIIAVGFGIQAVGIGHSLIFFVEALVLTHLVWMLRGPLPNAWTFDKSVLKGLLTAAYPLFLASLFAMVYISIDVIALRFLASPRTVGEYALVPQIIQAFQILPYAITLAAFPSLITDSARDSKTFLVNSAKIGRRLAFLGLVMSLILFGIAPSAIILVLGAEYAVTSSLIQVGALCLPFAYLRQLTTKVFICLNRGKTLAIVELVGLISALLLNLSLIPLYGAFGAALSVVLTYALTVFLALGSLGLLKPIFGWHGPRDA